MSTEKQSTTYYIEGLCCIEEESAVRRSLKSLGTKVCSSNFNLLNRTLTVEHTCAEEKIGAAIRKAGFIPRVRHHADGDQPQQKQKLQRALTIVSGSLIALALILEHFSDAQNLSRVFLGLSIVASGWGIARKALRSLMSLSLDMNFLMAIATAGAIILGEWEEAAAVIFLFAVSHLLEQYSLDRTRKAIRSLLQLSPPVATVVRNEAETTVDVDTIVIGNHILIRPGERVPLDGIVIRGSSTVNESPITGESIPTLKEEGSFVYAGSFNERGVLEVEVTHRSADTTLARIVRMVEESQTQRAPIQQFTERFARYYTPAVVIAAALMAFFPPLLLNAAFSDWIYRALVLLVISCPCALVISTPVTFVSGLTAAARHGVLIKGGRALEHVGRVRAFAFDKTGTLTKGKPVVTDVIPVTSMSSTELLTIAAGIESRSEHHLAEAVLTHASKQNIHSDGSVFNEFESLPGLGIRARSNGQSYILGNHALIEQEGMCSSKTEEVISSLEAHGKSVVVLGTKQEPLGVIGILDDIRPETPGVVAELRSNGIDRVIMITGDHLTTAKAIAEKAGIGDISAATMPEEKVKRIQEMRARYGSVAMVGDGVNDAPALAQADVGIAMGGSGTDIAMETADIVLMSDDISKLPYILSLSRKVVTIVKQNIAIALLTKATFIILGFFGIASLWLAILADDGAALAVIINGLRVLNYRGEK